MQLVMFTKHLEGLDLPGIIRGLKEAGLDGADLCVRPGYPVNPDNVKDELPRAVKAFADEGLSIPLVTTPGDFRTPDDPRAEPLYAACGECGVKLIKLGYWLFDKGDDYWKRVDEHRKHLEGFAALSRKYGVKTVVHTHSGSYMALNASAAHHLVDGFDPQEIGVYLDTGHLAICGEPMPMAISIVRKYVACFAFKDLWKLPGPWGGRYIYRPETRKLGWGSVDWEEVAEAIISAGLDDLTISLHSEYGGLPPEAVLGITRADVWFVRDLFERTRRKLEEQRNA